MEILVSACLLGEKCRYDGKNNYDDKIKKIKEKFDIIPICPELLGGLKIPRIPSEIKNGRVINKENKDVTYNFNLGKDKVLNIAKFRKIKYAILKENSPSCGVHFIYDGSFKNKLIEGKGISSKALEEIGVTCLTLDEAIETLL